MFCVCAIRSHSMTGSELHIELRDDPFGPGRPPGADLVSAAYGGGPPRGGKLPKTMAADDAHLGGYPCGIATQCGSRAPYSGANSYALRKQSSRQTMSYC